MTDISPIRRQRRTFDDAYKREQLQRVTAGEITLAELSRELDISRGTLQRWKSLYGKRHRGKVASRERVGTSHAGPEENEVDLLRRAVVRLTLDLERRSGPRMGP